MSERSGKDRQPRRPMSAACALAILDRLERNGVTAWLEGGWAIDALLGLRTRRHDDLDVLVRLEEVDATEAALAEAGYERVSGAPPTSFYLVDSRGHQVDVHPVAFQDTGEAVYRLETGKEWIYAAGSFAGGGEIAGRPVRCLTPETMLVNHTTGYALDAEHQRDVEALSERFGLPLPEFLRA